MQTPKVPQASSSDWASFIFISTVEEEIGFSEADARAKEEVERNFRNCIEINNY